MLETAIIFLVRNSHGIGAKVNANYARKLIKDNSLDIAVKGRSNGIINFYTNSDEDLRTLRELLLGMGITLQESPTCFYIHKTIVRG